MFEYLNMFSFVTCSCLHMCVLICILMNLDVVNLTSGHTVTQSFFDLMLLSLFIYCYFVLVVTMEILENKDVSIVFSVCLKAIGLF